MCIDQCRQTRDPLTDGAHHHDVEARVLLRPIRAPVQRRASNEADLQLAHKLLYARQSRAGRAAHQSAQQQHAHGDQHPQAGQWSSFQAVDVALTAKAALPRGFIR